MTTSWRVRTWVYYDEQLADQALLWPAEEVRPLLQEADRASHRKEEPSAAAQRTAVGLWSAERRLALRTPREWRRLLRGIHVGDTHNHLASIIWWDYISDTDEAAHPFWERRIFHLPTEVPDHRLSTAMRKVGWTDYHAWRRLTRQKGL